MSDAATHLSRACPRMRAIIRRLGPPRLQTDKQSPYEALVRAIAHQQLHANAARAITRRFLALYGDAFPAPESLLATGEAALRACGFSMGKVAAIRDIAARTLDGTIPSRRAAQRLSDDALIQRMTQVRGVGRWTVEMVLMHSLARPDIWPVDDFGVREGYRLLYGLETQPKPKALRDLGALYAPHRSTAAWYCWRAVDEAKGKT
jgi:DNA-3-methyladenine glycosylase II